jgi:DNA modification methylase
MRSCISLRMERRYELPSYFEGPDVRFPEGLVECFLREYTREGDVVFDPFAGFGTTLRVAEYMGRIPSGLELDERRLSYARSQLRQPHGLLHGDARRLSSYDLPAFDFSITSPPYTGRHDTPDPLTSYTTEGLGYERYLEDLQEIYAQIERLMKPEAHAVLEVANLKQPGGATTLAWDIGKAISEVLFFEGEVVVDWRDTYGYGYDHSYCLIYSKRK